MTCLLSILGREEEGRERKKEMRREKGRKKREGKIGREEGIMGGRRERKNKGRKGWF